MSRTAFVLGGTGLIGRALAPLLVEDGFEVTVGSRRPPPEDLEIAHFEIDREDGDRFDELARRDFDVFVDVVAYRQSHAEQLMRLQGRVGSLVVISSAAVYADPDGKTLLGSERGDGAPIAESHPVVAAVPDGSDYAGGKVAVEQTLLESELPVTILRPGAIFGPGDRASREWHFVKRVLDGRRPLVLAYMGASKFHTVSSANLAVVVVKAAERSTTGAFNCGDLLPPDVHSIGEAIGDAMGHEFEFTVIDGPPRGVVGDTPWSVPRPFVLDLTAVKRHLDFAPVGQYEDAASETCRWLVEATKDRAWEEVLPQAAHHYGSLFDYEAEDEFLRSGRSNLGP